MMHSAIYEGTIRHRRFRPVENSFRYRLFMMYLDLSELDAVVDMHPFWSVERRNLAVFRRRDYPGDPRVDLGISVRSWIQARTGEWPTGPIRLLTHLRYFGVSFNPVSFYYCFDARDRAVEYIVAEIRNTPWLEYHRYLFTSWDNRHPSSDWRSYEFKKRFHVSPFMEMGIRYDWRFRVPEERLNVHMINYRGKERIFDAGLDLRRREIDRRSLSKILLRYPPMTAKVILMIYRQALRLWWKGAPFFSHPDKLVPKAKEG